MCLSIWLQLRFSQWVKPCDVLQERRRSSGTAASMMETELGALREQSLTHVKERVALKAILDDKVRALISDIGHSVAELPIEVLLQPPLNFIPKS